MRGLRALLIAVLLIAALLIGADRVVAAVAEDRLADRLQQRLSLATVPEVTIHGFPLLTQAISGTYREIEVHATGLEIGGYRDLDLDVRLRDVDLPLSKAIQADVTGAVAKTAEATVRIPESSISEVAGLDVAIDSASGNAITMSTTVGLPGRSVPVSITAEAQTEGSTVQLTVLEATAADVVLPSDLVASISDSLALSVPVPALPQGMSLQSASAAPGALVLTATGTDIPLSTVG